MGILEILGNYLGKPVATPEMLGELLNSATYIPKKIYNTVTSNSDLPSLVNSAEAATIPRQQRDEEELLGNIKTPQSMQAQTQPRQQDDSPYLGMINSMFNQKPTSKWDDIFNTITKRTQQVSGILNTIGGDNSALNHVVQNQRPINPLDMERLQEQIRHNKEIEKLSGIKANKGSGGDDLKTLTTSAVEKLSDSDRAINELANLSDKMNKNIEAVGVVSGLRKYNPFDVQARSLQADVDRVRQLVGRALEGGVLRKEDEQKYKKILAEITDDPSVARYKIKEITRDMESNKETNLSNFEKAGYKTSGFRTGSKSNKTQTSSLKRRRYNPETGSFEEI